ncbi:MAG TPA: NAD(P)/FAD-dependent oxidoreductase [Capsulimonadaceae bacterium]|nr:NAD(P)/FAD-dependent oxidoreductase [Capsulimonadaceae bacterium]
MTAAVSYLERSIRFYGVESAESYRLAKENETMGMALPRVVIVGGGFGGLNAARGLAHAPVQVTLIDQHNYHLFRPMLYQVATGLLPAEEIAAPLRSVLKNQRNTDVLMAEVTGIDKENRLVRTRHDSIPYEYLILATGVQYNYFGHDKWKELAPSLTTVDDADRIRDRMLASFERAENLAASDRGDQGEIQALMTFVLVGGGTTGVEMAGAIAELAKVSLARDFRHIDPQKARILLFEAGGRILAGFPEEFSEKALRRLVEMGVEVRTGTAVQQIEPDGVIVQGEKIACHNMIWAAGVVASAAGEWLGAEVDKQGRVKVEADLSVPGFPEIFVIGDTASVVAPTYNLVGMSTGKTEQMAAVAPPAIQEGQYVARVIRRKARGLHPPGPFAYWDKGSLAIVGRSFAVADLKIARFWGFLGWALWLTVHILYLIGFANRLFVLLQWGISFWTNKRDVRILPSGPDEDSQPAQAKASAATS